MDLEVILGGLNPQQRQAAEAVDGPYLVVAGAGSGKTTVLARRVAALISYGIDPASILLLTFTRAAARNMIDRAKKMTPTAIDVAGGTFHSIAHKLVLENHSMFRLPERPTILDPEDVKAAFRKIAAANGGKSENMPKASALAKIHSYAVNTKQPIEDVVWERLSQFSYAMEFITTCAAEFKDYKRTRGLLDYDDLLVAWDAMMDHPRVGQAVRDRFRYILLDEYQDSNALQCSIVAKLGGETPNVMAVGDPAQSIYAFRGAAPRTMFAFKETWPSATVINLDTNYRSGEDILGVANAVDRSMRERFDRELKPCSGASGEPARLMMVADMDSEASKIADLVLDHKENGTDLDEQAVLVRSMMASRHVEAEFIRRRIPYKVSGGIRISEAAHIKDVLCLARIAVNTLDEPAWVRVLTMAKGVGDKKASGLYAKIAGKEDRPGNAPRTVISPLFGKHPDLSAILDAYEALSAGGPPTEILDRSMSILENLFQQRYDDWKTRKADIAAVCGMADSHETLDLFLSNLTLDHSVDKKATVVGLDEQEAPVTISTVHSAKGLEWDVVYVPSFVDGHIPSMYSKEPEDIEEERRVLYVAVTRPRRCLYMFRPAIGRQYALASESPFENVVADLMVRERIGQARRPSSFSLGVDADIDIFG